MEALLSRWKKLLRFFDPMPSRLAYIHEIKASGLFDRQFYTSTNPQLHWLFKAMPERHFAVFGEAMGLYPNPDFSPRAYLMHNPDVTEAGLPPFRHWINQGRSEARLTKSVGEIVLDASVSLPTLRGGRARQAELAIVVHLYYHELWDEFAARLRKLDFAFDLFVTVTAKGKDDQGRSIAGRTRERIEADFPGAVTLEMPNHGRDIFPFLHLVNSGWLSGYSAVAKFHSKMSPHRQDGEHWRRHLIDGILPETGARALVDRFLADSRAGFWVADGQHYTGAEWWGSNFARVKTLLERVEIGVDRSHLSFPAGSIYWLKPVLIDLIRGLGLTEDQFERELGQTDGTTAHAVERLLGPLCEAAGLEIRQTTQLQAPPPVRPARVKPAYVQAFYLPQFHTTLENDAWWGKGYTEWMAAARARPQFAGHAQPQLPADLGFYDLRVTEVMGEQARLARSAGIDAFCVYHYWFDPRRILESPIDRLLQRPDIDFPFYLCWANESWRRNWDGLSGEVLLEQAYAPGWEDRLAESLLPYFRDPRYQRPDGTRPRFVIYRPEDMPDPAASVARLRAAWDRLGIGAVELGAVRFHVPGEHPVAETLFDFWIEMPPHGLVQGPDYLFGGPDGPRMQPQVFAGFQGLIYAYANLAARATDPAHVARLPRNTIAGIMPSWDNTARRGTRAHIAWGAHPGSFAHWLDRLMEARIATSYRQELMINAWNEWAEKAMLEPSAQWGRAQLDVLTRALTTARTED